MANKVNESESGTEQADSEKTLSAKRLLDRFRQKYPACILLFQMGDCYEAFFEDAEVLSQVCELVLSVRNRGKNFILFVSIPYPLFNKCRKKILQAGYKLANLQQIESLQGNRRDVVTIFNAPQLFSGGKWPTG